MRALMLLLLLVIAKISFSQKPVITSFSPLKGKPGAQVTINGSGFNSDPSGNIVYFGSAKALVVSATATQIVASVPNSSTHEPITVVTNGLSTKSSAYFLPTFTLYGPNQLNATFFSEATRHTLPINPDALISADFDNDGKTDIVAGSFVSTNIDVASIGVLRNLSSPGQISMAPAQSVPCDPQTNSIDKADFNSDGKIDLVTTNATNDVVRILMNTSTSGSISFNNITTINLTSTASQVIAADLDNDGKSDIIVSNHFSSGMSIYRNISTGPTTVFSSPVTLSTEAFSLNFITGDLDGDYKPEILVSNNEFNKVTIFKNNSQAGNLQFQVWKTLNLDYKPGKLTLGDANNDARPDVFVASYTDNKLAVFGNQASPGDITLVRNYSFTGGLSLPATALGDLNGDGWVDLVSTGSPFSIHSNTSLNFANPFTPTVPPGSLYQAIITDMDMDGVPDIVGGVTLSNEVAIFRNRITNPFITRFLPLTGRAGEDITIRGYNLESATSVFFGNQPATSFSISNPTMIIARLGNNGASGDIKVNTTNGQATIAGFTFIYPLSIDSLSTDTGWLGSELIIYGSNLKNIVSVKLGGIPAASFTEVDEKKLIVKVGNGASGTVEVTTSTEIATRNGFVFVVPAITDFNPKQAGINETVEIIGTYFTQPVKVYFGGSEALKVTYISSTKILAEVGGGLSGAITVTGGSGLVRMEGFTYKISNKPEITGINKYRAEPGSEIEITGNNFGSLGESKVFFDNLQAEIISLSATQIKVKVPAGSTLSNINVLNTTNGLRAISERPFLTFNNKIGFHHQPPYLNNFKNSDIEVGNYLDNGRNILVDDWDGNGTPDAMFDSNPGFFISDSLKVEDGDTVRADFKQFTLKNSGRPYKIESADVDGDGLSELMVYPLTAVYFPDTTKLKFSIYKNTSKPGHIAFDDSNMVQFPIVGYPISAEIKPLNFADFNLDGKYDILLKLRPDKTAILLNSSSMGKIEFVQDSSALINHNLPDHPNVLVKDINGDGKPDLTWISNYKNGSQTIYRLNYLRNTSTPGILSFAPPLLFDGLPGELLGGLESGDFNNDGQPEIILFSNNTSPGLKIYLMTPNGPSLVKLIELPVNQRYTSNISGLAGDAKLGDLNGDGYLDILTRFNPHYVLFENSALTSSFGFQMPVYANNTFRTSKLTDINRDGRVDLLEIDEVAKKVINKLNQPEKNPQQANVCFATGYVPEFVFSTAISGNNYKWYCDTGNGYVLLDQNFKKFNFLISPADRLNIEKLTGDAYGYKFRCITDERYPYSFQLRFVNTFIGNSNSSIPKDWSSYNFWQCGYPAREEEDAIIKGYNSVELNSSTTVRSLFIQNPASLKVAPGVILTIKK